ncbi:hypothetical protein [Nocardia sp.]|uniref:hypothetical protein n=1 Tax=Nocardia sp. TaxID=1821 RepID=UPI002604A06D|nr:hypothetical protein [Nocardia sp.]
MNEYKTRKGLVIRVGDEFRDTRESNIRTLRIDRLQMEDYGTVRAFCTVIRQEYDGEVTEPMRLTDMAADRFGTSDFRPAAKGIAAQAVVVDEVHLFDIEGDR